MITAFMVFKNIGPTTRTEGREDGGSLVFYQPKTWRLYFTTTESTEEDVIASALQRNWRVVKVTLDDELNGTCEVL